MRFLTMFLLFCVLLSCKAKPVRYQDGMVFIAGHSGLNDFFIDKTPVTVAQFAAFVNATVYQTDAERFGNASVFNMERGTWSLVTGATWLHPFGSADSIANDNFPVTQVSWNDAVAYCKWAGKRLPTIQEFEFAAKGGNDNYSNIYAWGDSIVSCGRYQVNAWQGSFPETNTVADGYKYASPVGIFGVNSIGLTDMGGNVWQWAQDWHPQKPGEKAQCGGSFLCDPNVCHGFKIGGLTSSTPETSLMHVGFRCVKDVNELAK